MKTTNIVIVCLFVLKISKRQRRRAQEMSFMKILRMLSYIMIMITSSLVIISPFIFGGTFGVHTGFAVFTFLLGLVSLFIG